MEKLDFNALKQKIDIVKVISHYLEVQKKGNNYVALCPFHNDSNPSMSISPTKQIFNCFVCHKGGDAFKFVSEYKKIPYIAAVKEACDICGVPCDIKLNDNKATNSKYQPLYAVLEDLTKYYEIYMFTTNGKEGLDYLTNRNIDSEIIKKFRIGFAPNDPSVSIEMMRNKNNHSIDALMNAGVLTSGSKFKDRYCGRIMFPITDAYGRVVGFSGRRIKESDDSKYINSPETAIFHKSELLYNYYESKDLCQKTGKLYLLEGFMDVIALSRCNLPSVGLMGTALTDYQVKLLRNRKVDIYLSLDSDDPGQEATIKSALLLAKNGISCKVVKELKDAKDPDELLTKFGQDALIKAMNEIEEPLIHFANFYKKKNLLDTYDQKNKFLEEFLPLFKLYSPVVLSSLIKDLVPIIELNEEAMNEYVSKNNVKEEIPEYIGEEESLGGFDFIDSTHVEETPVKRSYVIYGENAVNSIYHILQKNKTNDKDANIKKAEARIINLVRSSNYACTIVGLVIEDIYCDLVVKFFNYASKFYKENPNIKSLTKANLDKFYNEVPSVYNHSDLEYLVTVLHHYDNQLDSCHDSEKDINEFITTYNANLKRFRNFLNLNKNK